MTMKNIRETNKGYSFIAVDLAGFYWEEFDGSWSATGEMGWSTTDSDIDKAGIISVAVSEEEKIVYVYINDEL